MQQYLSKIHKGLSGIAFCLITLTLLLLSSVSFAQKTEGTIRYLKTSNYIKMLAAVDYLSQQAKDKSSYLWGNDAEGKSYGRLYLNATQTKYEDSEESAEKDDAGYSWRRDTYIVSRDFEKKTMHDAIDMVGKTYIIEDTLRAPKWKILTEMKEIAGHICMNAVWTDTVKKQKVVAWYALDIKNNGGPERFYGLSGLILEVNINDGALIITADKIEEKKLTTELDFPKKTKGKKIKEKDYVAILRKHIAEKRKMEQPAFYSIRY